MAGWPRWIAVSKARPLASDLGFSECCGSPASDDWYRSGWELRGHRVMHQSIPSANITQATPGALHLLSVQVPGFVPSEFPGGLPGVGPIIYYHKYQAVS